MMLRTATIESRAASRLLRKHGRKGQRLVGQQLLNFEHKIRGTCANKWIADALYILYFSELPQYFSCLNFMALTFSAGLLVGRSRFLLSQQTVFGHRAPFG